MTPPLLYVSGMFRSGTTLLSRMLHAHPEIGMAYDTTLPLFKQYRSRHASEIGDDIPPDAPLSDYYFDSRGLALLQRIRAADFTEVIDKETLGRVRDQLKSYTEPYSPLLVPELDALSGSTYREVLENLTYLIVKAYGKEDGSWVGYKNVWADEFVPAFASASPDARFIHIVRDPRAVAASKNSQDDRYPWLFLARQWRKLAALSWLNRRSDVFGDRVCIVRFEDLVTDPESTVQQICSFLRVDPHANMLDPSMYVDGEGKPWRQNTSYGKGAKAFDSRAVDRWRERLTRQEAAFIERLCYPEMALLGYNQRVDLRIPRSFMTNPPRVDTDLLADWIRPHIENEAAATAVEMGKEKIRQHTLEALVEGEDVEQALLEITFLDAAVAQEASVQVPSIAVENSEVPP